ncbi:rRNA pseudouridine synthase [Candidatus Saccharibacteria bacterium CPR2]|nr:rRNA pseudouridine synthase [Candidatus Saccharibacteria bacterium CPR2]
MRLNKFLANSLGISRREADNLIEKGRVIIDGNVVKLGAQVNINQPVEVDGGTVKPLKKHTYLLFNKPEGYVCSRNTQGDTPTVYKLLPDKYKRLKTVGRLDKNSTGLILLTDDGDLAYQLTHPKFAKEKVYEVELDKPLSTTHKDEIEDGVEIGDGLSRFKLKASKNFSEKIKNTKFLVYMREGRNRQIRRTFSALGYEVVKLHRIQFGPYKINGLESGEHREIAIGK